MTIDFFNEIGRYVIYVNIVLLIIYIIIKLLISIDQRKTETKKIADAEIKVEREPDKVKPAWDLARVTLESYFNKNLNQVSSIFWLSVIVLIIGFIIIVWGIAQAIQLPNSTLPSIITGLAGVITEFFGATFLFIYRSTMQQAINYTKTLERINSVGMAMQILDTIPNDANPKSLKDSTKAKVVELLMRQTYSKEPDGNDESS
jgi:hypothetical protein